MPMPNLADQITLLESPPFWPKSVSLKKYIKASISQTLISLRAQSPLSEFWAQILAHPLELNILLSHDGEIQELNAQWRQKNTPTNVLSFPGFTPEGPIKSLSALGPPVFLGDMILSYETCEKESRIQQKRFDHHLVHLAIHGLLHLLGMDHENDKDAHVMESLEIELLKNLGVSNPYLVIG